MKLPHRKHWYWMVPAGILVLLAATAAADWWLCLPPGLKPTYVGQQACIDCHQGEYQRWRGSDHDLAMDPATPETVLADFDNSEFTHHGITSRFFRRGDEYFVHTEGPDGAMADFRIDYTFGVRPLQQYMVTFPDGRVQCLSVAWDTDRKEWFHLYGDQRVPHDDWHHWTGPGQNWNHMCAECHSTNLQKNYHQDTNTFHTSWTDIDVSCEACHGPGSIHVDLAHSRSLFWDRRYGHGLAKLKGADATTQLETCAHCHSRHAMLYPLADAGERFHDHSMLTLLDGEEYYPDGQILGENYEYGSFLQSRMFREGVRCTDCHDPHSTRPKFAGNRLCTQCHTPGKYDGPVHHHHPTLSKGASCVECHMPERTYMVVDPRRDHSIRVPRPDLTVKLGVPNACQNCHTKPEESAQWAADKIVEWYGPKRRQDPHFGEILSAARQGRREAEPALIDLARYKPAQTKEQAMGPMVRASAVALLTRYASQRATSALLEALLDPEPMVRLAAVHNFPPLEGSALVAALAPRLQDTARVVRMEAARVLSSSAGQLSAADRAHFDAALADYETGQRYHADQAANRLNLAGVYSNLGRYREAEDEFLAALKLEPDFIPARISYATFLHLRGRSGEGESVLREGIRLAPTAQVGEYDPTAQLAELWYALGKLLDEFQPEPRHDDAITALKKAAELSPGNAVMRYNLGARLQMLRRYPEAERELLAALKLEPDWSDCLYALVLIYVQQHNLERARYYAARYVEVQPAELRWQAEQMIARMLASIEQSRPATIGPAVR